MKRVPSIDKRLVRPCLQTLLRNDLLWAVARRFPIRGVVAARKKVVSRRLASKYKHNPVVLSGPFRGLAYPRLASAGSTLMPKLLGTYESELQPTLGSFSTLQFSTIVDIGCAEGYYAVGFSRLFPSAKILAYDTSPKARNLCSEMAAMNNATNVDVREFCDRNELLALPAEKEALIISDCEGYEKELFDSAVIKHLRSSYFVIELHDFLDRTISRTLPPLFSATHEIEFVSSMPDQEKAVRYSSPFLGVCDPFEREVAFSENRPDMQWLVARPRNHRTPASAKLK